MSSQVLFGSTAFWTALALDIRAAKSRIAIQTMSFEGDAVGMALTAALCASPAEIKHLVIDHYSQFVINDRFRFAPQNWRDPALNAEWRATQAQIRTLQTHGVQVTFTNPMGWCGIHYPARNHKKIIVIDDAIAYLGGINFCEHNFEWPDLMVRIADSSVTQFLWEDVQSTISGRNQSRFEPISGQDFYVMNGQRSGPLYQRLFCEIDQAQRSITVCSPYITFPAMTHLKAAAKRGVAVTLYTPGHNNKAMLQHYIRYATAGSGIQVRAFSQKNFHLKAILIDDETLILGSSNFDVVSYYAEQEVIVVMRDPTVIGYFVDNVLGFYHHHATAFLPGSTFDWRGMLSHWALYIAGVWCRLITWRFWAE